MFQHTMQLRVFRGMSQEDLAQYIGLMEHGAIQWEVETASHTSLTVGVRELSFWTAPCSHSHFRFKNYTLGPIFLLPYSL